MAKTTTATCPDRQTNLHMQRVRLHPGCLGARGAARLQPSRCPRAPGEPLRETGCQAGPEVTQRGWTPTSAPWACCWAGRSPTGPRYLRPPRPPAFHEEAGHTSATRQATGWEASRASLVQRSVSSKGRSLERRASAQAGGQTPPWQRAEPPQPGAVYPAAGGGDARQGPTRVAGGREGARARESRYLPRASRTALLRRGPAAPPTPRAGAGWAALPPPALGPAGSGQVASGAGGRLALRVLRAVNGGGGNRGSEAGVERQAGALYPRLLGNRLCATLPLPPLPRSRPPHEYANEGAGPPRGPKRGGGRRRRRAANEGGRRGARAPPRGAARADWPRRGEGGQNLLPWLGDGCGLGVAREGHRVQRRAPTMAREATGRQAEGGAGGSSP